MRNSVLLISLLLFFIPIFSFAANKVVVVPLFSRGDKVPTVVSKTGRVWMDRNLGAYRVAQRVDDYQAYGWLYQWGRLADGHESRSIPTTTTKSFNHIPGHDHFILASTVPFDWKTIVNNLLWQGENGINNPCPQGFRLPTETELKAERDSWSTKNAAGAYASPLKLVVAGYRHCSNGTIGLAGSYGYYWSSTVSGTHSRVLSFSSGGADVGSGLRAGGFSVRCLKD